MSREEFVDILDENFNLTGKVTALGEAHQNHIPHRVSAVLVFKPNGNLLVQVHKHHNRLLDHSVGGHVSAGESYEVAAKREMEEELRIKTPITKVADGVVSREHYPKINTSLIHIFGIFTARVPQNWTLISTEEVDMIEEMNVKDIVEKMNREPDQFLQGFLTTLGAYLALTGSEYKIQAYGKNWGEL